MPCDREAEAQAAMPADGAAIRLPKTVKHIRNEIVFDSLSAILHAKLGMIAGAKSKNPMRVIALDLAPEKLKLAIELTDGRVKHIVDSYVKRRKI